MSDDKLFNRGHLIMLIVSLVGVLIGYVAHIDWLQSYGGALASMSSLTC